jgi:hypothetical protein
MPNLKRVLDAHTSKPTLNTIVNRHTKPVRSRTTRLAKEVRRGHDNAR